MTRFFFGLNLGCTIVDMAMLAWALSNHNDFVLYWSASLGWNLVLTTYFFHKLAPAEVNKGSSK